MCYFLSFLSLQRSTAFSFQLVLVSFLSCILQLHLMLASRVPILRIGTSIRGATIGAPHLVNVDEHSTGQALFELPVSRELLTRLQTQNSDVSVTTCSKFTSFDTVLFAFASNPLNRIVSKPKWINKNDNDCGYQSSIQVKVSSETSLYFLLTGYRGAQGAYEIRAEEILVGEVPVPWGLDRIDQRSLPLDGRFSVKEAGQGVFIYILDSGVRASHDEFLRRDGSTRVTFGNDFVERLDAIGDESGHGTHVAALAAGRSYGVAKQASIVSVRVLDRTDSGLVSQIVEALEWTRKDIHRKNNLPAVIVMSLSTLSSKILNEAVAKVTSAGISVVTAAGNDGKDSCLVSPASEKSTLTVGAADENDQESMISNWGDCVSVYAPGEGILSAWHTGDSGKKELSGTSSACPLVAGAIAILLEQNPLLKPNEITEVIKATSTVSIKKNKNVMDESKKRESSTERESLGRMLYVRSIPVVLRDARPRQGMMFLYVIFGLASETDRHQRCYLTESHISDIQSLLSTVFRSLKTSVDLTMCCRGHLQEGCDDGDIFPGNRLIVRVMARDSYAYTAFESLSAFCRKKKGAVWKLKAVLETNVSVAAEPWVLDSRGYKYWAAPAFIRTANRGLSTSMVVLIVCLITLLVLCMVAIMFHLIKRSKRKQRRRDQDYFEEKANEYEAEKQRHPDIGAHEDLKPTPICPQGIKRINSEVQGDVLKDLSPSGVVPTPTTHGIGTERSNDGSLTPIRRKKDMYLNLFSDFDDPFDVQTPAADQPRRSRGLPERNQTSTPFFRKLWTPRTDKKSARAGPASMKSPFRRLNRILSFGPERGAVVQSNLPTQTQSSIATQPTQEGANAGETDGEGLQTNICTEGSPKE